MKDIKYLTVFLENLQGDEGPYWNFSSEIYGRQTIIIKVRKMNNRYDLGLPNI